MYLEWVCIYREWFVYYTWSEFVYTGSGLYLLGVSLNRPEWFVYTGGGLYIPGVGLYIPRVVCIYWGWFVYTGSGLYILMGVVCIYREWIRIHREWFLYTRRCLYILGSGLYILGMSMKCLYKGVVLEYNIIV